MDGNVVGWKTKKVGVDVGTGNGIGVAVGIAICVPTIFVLAIDTAVSIAPVELNAGVELKRLQAVKIKATRNSGIFTLLMIFMISFDCSHGLCKGSPVHTSLGDRLGYCVIGRNINAYSLSSEIFTWNFRSNVDLLIAIDEVIRVPPNI